MVSNYIPTEVDLYNGIQEAYNRVKHTFISRSLDDALEYYFQAIRYNILTKYEYQTKDSFISFLVSCLSNFFKNQIRDEERAEKFETCSFDDLESQGVDLSKVSYLADVAEEYAEDFQEDFSTWSKFQFLDPRVKRSVLRLLPSDMASFFNSPFKFAEGEFQRVSEKSLFLTYKDGSLLKFKASDLQGDLLDAFNQLQSLVNATKSFKFAKVDF